MDLTTRYLGMTLRSPLVASPSPMSQTADGVRQMADGGVGAVVLYSLFEEQLLRDAERDSRLAAAGAESFGEALSYFPQDVDPAESDPSRLTADEFQTAVSHMQDGAAVAPSLRGAGVERNDLVDAGQLPQSMLNELVEAFRGAYVVDLPLDHRLLDLAG